MCLQDKCQRSLRGFWGVWEGFSGFGNVLGGVREGLGRFGSVLEGLGGGW